MLFDLERVRKNVSTATTEDLLDRATAYRAGMEPDALDVIEEELQRRGVTTDEMAEHGRRRRLEINVLSDGTAARCSFCHRPAVAEQCGWHRLWGLVPIFPCLFRYCAEHQPERAEPDPQ
jgi:hypothetical protein